jgi:pimeloyl-ACP methyl ester carboxylesterase
MPEVTANGIRHCYEVTGEGPTTIVWIHGIGGSHHYWDEVLAQFPGFKHISYDVRGMGDSDGTEGAVSLEDWAADCNGLLEALGVEQAIIAGTSMGGAITMRFGIDFPEKVKALLLLSTSSRVGQAATDHWMAQADNTEADGRPRLAAAQRAVAKYHMDEEIKAFNVPTLIIVGDADKTTPAGGSVIMSRCIPDSELEIYPGIGHSPLKEEPKSVERVRGWLAQFAS